MCNIAATQLVEEADFAHLKEELEEFLETTVLPLLQKWVEWDAEESKTPLEPHEAAATIAL